MMRSFRTRPGRPTDGTYSVDVLGELADAEVAGEQGAVLLGSQADELAGEQADLYAAAGQAAGRPPLVQAAGLSVPDRVLEAQVDQLDSLVTAAVRLAEATRRGLGPFVQRPPDAKAWYVGRLLVLFGGDVAAISGAAILLGEIPALAVTLALATGIAPITGGLAGAEAKRIRLATERHRDPENLPEHLQPWQHLFAGAQPGRRVMPAMQAIAAMIIIAVLTGVVALRTSLDGPLSGIAFGAFALAVSLASVWNSWSYADDIADVINAADKAVATAMKRQARLAHHPTISGYHRAATHAGSIQQQHHALGSGAAHRVRAILCGVLARTPHTPPSDTSGLGRRLRPHPEQANGTPVPTTVQVPLTDTGNR